MSTSESSLTDELLCAEDLPPLAKSLPQGYDASFFTKVAELHAHHLPLTPSGSYPAEVAALFNEYGRKCFNSFGHLFDKESKYQTAVELCVFASLLTSSFEKRLFYNHLEFGNNVAADGCIERPASENPHLLKLILEFKSPASESGGRPPKAEDLHLQIGQAFVYAKYAYLDKYSNPEYQFEKTVFHYNT